MCGQWSFIHDFPYIYIAEVTFNVCVLLYRSKIFQNPDLQCRMLSFLTSFMSVFNNCPVFYRPLGSDQNQAGNVKYTRRKFNHYYERLEEE